ncbi:protein kinase [Nocardia sp. XZ_19_385]|uniref:protein kinase domain-containing protein n=1 Tax=Nocardia sp. XZ_19_385 TaxID=2769488 RepID=UPI001E289CFC|nr:protein kinase [Nocardia sp. XZ_19_385]
MNAPQIPQPVQRLADDDPGTIGRYRLLGRLGSGGMGAVFLAVSPGRRLVAVKMVHPHLARDREFRQRFAREVQAARAVGGFHTPAVVDADVSGVMPWSATEYIAAPALDQVVARFGPLPVESVWELARGMAEALQAIHAAQVVHRDLKPSNVLIAADGPRVIDFGIAQALGEGQTFTLTGGVIGTPAYMSPEQARGDFTGPASDVFALGSVLVFAASGRGPFGDGDAMALLMRVANGAPDLSGAPPGTLGDIVAQCLSGNPADRPRPADLLALLNRPARPAPQDWLPPVVSEGTRAYSRAIADITQQADFEFVPATRRFRPELLIALLAVIALVVAGGLAYRALRDAGNDTATTTSTAPTTAAAKPVRIPAEVSPRTLSISADGSQLFVVGTTGGGEFLSRVGGVQFIDTKTNAPIRTVKFDLDMSGEAVVAPDGRRIYAPSKARKVVRILDGVTGAEIGELGPIEAPRVAGMSRDSKLIYVPDGDGLAVFDAETKARVGDRIPIGRAPGRSWPLPDGSKWFISEYDTLNLAEKDITVYQPGTGAITTIGIGTSPHDLAFSADGTRAAVATFNANRVILIDTASETVTGSVDLGTQTAGVALSADGSRAYVSLLSTATIAVIDTATAAVVDTIRAEQEPQGLAISADNLYVANAGSGSISVIALS